MARGVYSAIINSILMVSLGLIIEIPKNYYDQLNVCLKTQNPIVINKG